MGLLHIGQTQRTSSHFTRHLWAKDDLRYLNLLWLSLTHRAQLLLRTRLSPSLPQYNPFGLPAVQAGRRASPARDRWDGVETGGSRTCIVLISVKRYPGHISLLTSDEKHVGTGAHLTHLSP